MSKSNRFKDRCPICHSKNSCKQGGTDNCFHCKNCDFVECEHDRDEYKKITKVINKRLKDFYSYYKKEK